MLLRNLDPSIIIPGGPVPWEKEDVIMTSEMIQQSDGFSQLLVNPRRIEDVRTGFFADAEKSIDTIAHSHTPKKSSSLSSAGRRMTTSTTVTDISSESFNIPGQVSGSRRQTPELRSHNTRSPLHRDILSPARISRDVPSPARTHLDSPFTPASRTSSPNSGSIQLKSPARSTSSVNPKSPYQNRSILDGRRQSITSNTTSNSPSEPDLAFTGRYSASTLLNRPDVLAMPLAERGEYIRRLVHFGAKDSGNIPRTRASPAPNQRVSRSSYSPPNSTSAGRALSAGRTGDPPFPYPLPQFRSDPTIKSPFGGRPQSVQHHRDAVPGPPPDSRSNSVVQLRENILRQEPDDFPIPTHHQEPVEYLHPQCHASHHNLFEALFPVYQQLWLVLEFE